MEISSKNFFINQKYFIWLKKVINRVCFRFYFFLGTVTIVPSSKELFSTFFFLFYNVNCQFKNLADISGVDYPQKKYRFSIFYQLLSFRYNQRLTVKVSPKIAESLLSISSIFQAANWYEREVFDLFGVFFKGHPDLRRLLTDYGFEGAPLRKDFPLEGFLSLRYDIEKKRVSYEPLDLSQGFRQAFQRESQNASFYKKHDILFIKLYRFNLRCYGVSVGKRVSF